MMEFSEQLYFWRTRKNFSVYKLSKISGISENHIRSLENGKKQPTIKTLQALTDALNITISEFFNTNNHKVIYLTEKEWNLLNFYRTLPKEKADILIEFYEKMCN